MDELLSIIFIFSSCKCKSKQTEQTKMKIKGRHYVAKYPLIFLGFD